MTSQNIEPIELIDNEVILPGSKSITNRAFLLAALCADGEETQLEGALDCEDTRVMISGLEAAGFKLSYDGPLKQVRIVGRASRRDSRFSLADPCSIYVANSGTTARFLAAALAFLQDYFIIHGSPRMHQRPISDLVSALNDWGGNVQCSSSNGCPPVQIQPCSVEGLAPSLFRASLSGDVSSQFISALLMAAPLVSQRAAVELHIVDVPVSQPYIEMTLQMMRCFGVSPAEARPFELYRFGKQTAYHSPGVYRIEPDASAASYFMAAAAVCGGRIRIPGLSRNSLQGDIAFADCLEQMGCRVDWEENAITVTRNKEEPLKAVTVDMNAISDTAQTLAVVALFAQGTTRVTHIGHARHKETDRISAVVNELRKFGALVEEKDDGFAITPPDKLMPARVCTYDDHRMAMSFSIAGLQCPGVVIENPQCVSKTFPEFFQVLAQLGKYGLE